MSLPSRGAEPAAAQVAIKAAEAAQEPSVAPEPSIYLSRAAQVQQNLWVKLQGHKLPSGNELRTKLDTPSPIVYSENGVQISIAHFSEEIVRVIVMIPTSQSIRSDRFAAIEIGDGSNAYVNYGSGNEILLMDVTALEERLPEIINLIEDADRAITNSGLEVDGRDTRVLETIIRQQGKIVKLRSSVPT
jgi:hypothetical protein